MIRRYEPFVIRVDEPVEGHYLAVAEFQGASWSGTIPVELPLLKEEEIRQAQEWLERGFIDRDYAKDFGKRLFRTLFADALRDGFRSAFERVAAQGGLRVILKLPSALADLPWELMYDEDGGHGFLARSVTAPLVRHFPGMPLPHSPPQEGPLRILIVTASPQGYPPVSAEQEVEALRERLSRPRWSLTDTLRLAWRDLAQTRSLRGLAQHLRERNMVDLQILKGATRARLQQEIRGGDGGASPYHVVHFVGHGDTDPSGGRLLLETDEGKGDPVPAEQLAELIDETSVNLVVFNACQTAGAMKIFNSVAQATLRRGIPAVIGMQVPILDRAALNFAREFYSAWAGGEPIESALAYARRLMSGETRAAADWGIPVLHMGPTEGLCLQMPVPPLQWPRRIIAVIGFVLMTLIPLLYFYGGLLPRGPVAMHGAFNVAVADFGEQSSKGKATHQTQDGALIGEQVYSDLKTAIGKDDYLQEPRVQLQHDNIDFIQGATAGERAQAASELAAKINATVIIYGTLDTTATPYVLLPEFYVAPSFRGAEELVSEEVFGKPIPLRMPLSDPLNRMDAAEKLQPRVNAWSFFTLGLAYLHLDKPDKALSYLQRAEGIAAWGPAPNQGKEVVYLFEGATLAKQGSDEDLRKAEGMFQLALDQTQGQYSRAWLGMGNLLLQRVQSRITSRRVVDFQLVDRAIIQYTRALTAEHKPSGAYVDVKAYSNLGVAFGYKALNPIAECPDVTAIETLSKPISEYEQNPTVGLLQQLGAQGYYQTGRMYEICGDQHKRESKTSEAIRFYTEAATRYEKSIAIALPKTVREPGWLGLPIGAPPPRVDEQDWQRLRWTATHQLAYTCSARAEMGDSALYAQAQARYQDVVNEYEKQKARGGNAISDLLATEAYYNLGLSLEQRGEKETAIQAYRRVLQLAADGSPLRAQALTRLQALGQK